MDKPKENAVLHTLLKLRNDALDLGMRELSLAYNESARKLANDITLKHMAAFAKAVDAASRKL
jgi:hypothetical protein